MKSTLTHLKHLSALSGAAATLVVLTTVPAAATPTSTPYVPRPALTAQASASSVRISEEFRISGESHDMPAGTPVTLQQRQGARWVPLPASVNTTPQGTYKMRVVLGLEGRNALRVAGGEAVSPVVHVTVRP
ncbi:hypothetical protein DEJ48_04495 [Streptomyces venezuelae]|uniref:Bacterial Ig domain-containing protein n=1 Tax=Streptomyces venezuelae TaxID=54571 RepID=A0A5P2BRF3_STRVZ|nr:hypothetical protein [Streptomyces venezuelae]QES32757.1 hypothetical protein DEJ48_04495 [Streptomyces venezuelae]